MRGTYSLVRLQVPILVFRLLVAIRLMASVSGNVVTLLQVEPYRLQQVRAGFNLRCRPPVIKTLTIIDDTLMRRQLHGLSPFQLCYGTADTNMTASASSGLAITYISSDSNVVDVNGSFLKIIGAGTATVSASQGGMVNIPLPPRWIRM